MRHLIGLLALALAACASPPAFDPATPPLVLTGEITRADHQTYREIPFTPPPGTGRITIDFAYTGKDQKTVIDIGVRDPDGQRGWSGGNKSHIEIGWDPSLQMYSATPSYGTGPIPPGEWRLVLGIPNIRVGQMASYTATINFSPTPTTGFGYPEYVPETQLSTEPGWRRGDFHMHTAHSDGACEIDGARNPCPAINTFEAARDARLDFVAITDHNTITQLLDITVEQNNFPKTLLIPGTEVTTFFGHANVIGNTDFVDFQLGSPRLPTLSKLFDEAVSQGAIVSINHPSLPSGEICMGCGWTAKDTDWSRVTAVEAVNGSTLRTTGSDAGGIRFWDSLLKQGYRITAIGGSDNHDATDRTGAKQSPVGKPATVVYARDLSVRGIVDGVRSGRVFVDVAGLPGAELDMNAASDAGGVRMGGELPVRDGKSAILTLVQRNLPPGAQNAFVADGVVLKDTTGPQPAPGPKGHVFLSLDASLAPGVTHGYVRVEVRGADGKLLLLGNPIYLRRASTP